MAESQILYTFHFLWPPIWPPWCYESGCTVGGRDSSLVHQLELEVTLLKTLYMLQSKKRQANTPERV